VVVSTRLWLVCVLVLVLVQLIPTSVSFAFDLATYRLSGKVDKANEAFAEGKLDEAFMAYSDGILADQDSKELQFNLGDVHYQKGNFEEARKAFEQALAHEGKGKRSQAYYNLGNTLYRLGMASQDMKGLEHAIEAYKQALELNPDDVDAKYNIEYIQRKLKENSKRQSKDGKQKEQNKDQDEQQQQQQKDKQQQQQQKQQKDKKDEQQQPEQQKQQDEKDQQQELEKPQSQKKNDKKLDEEQARRILDRLKDREKKELKENMQRQPARAGDIVNDW